MIWYIAFVKRDRTWSSHATNMTNNSEYFALVVCHLVISLDLVDHILNVKVNSKFRNQGQHQNTSTRNSAPGFEFARVMGIKKKETT